VGRRRADLITAVAFGVLAAVFLWSGRELRFTTDQGVPGAGFFPLLLALATLLMSVALGVQALRHDPRERSDETGRDGERAATDRTALADQTGLDRVRSVDVADPALAEDDDAALSPRRTLVVWGLVLASAVGLPALGFVPAMLLLSCGIMFGVERRFDPLSVLSAVLLPVLTYLLFGELLEVRLPAGPFE
jgi:hypothetical protein